MAKGSGMSGSRGSGGTGGRSGGESRGDASLGRIAGTGGGLSGASYLRGGMRDMSSVRAAFAGSTPKQATAIALGKRASRTGAVLPAVTVSVSMDRGRRVVRLEDGRHRLTAAREAGATHIQARVTEYGPRGGIRRTYTGPVRI